MFRYIPGKCHDIPSYSGIFRDIPAYSVVFRDIPAYSGIPGFHNAPLASYKSSKRTHFKAKLDAKGQFFNKIQC